MKKRILRTLIFSLLVLTACSSNETTNTTPNEIAPSAIVETKVEENVKETVAQTEKSA